ncbi:MAG TPA: hypothetical protein VHF45_00060 [Thermoleophilaceae bacterium]|nr:hypothetical protein [Thermoleophilaceae bacterium]
MPARAAFVAAAVLGLSAAAPPAAGHDYPSFTYDGLGAWIDIYDHGPWQRPALTVRALARRGVGTLFVQTSNHRQRRALHRPAALTRLLAAAELRGLRTVAWYLPGFDRPGRDWRRVQAAVTHVTPRGDRFDGFALDIEATVVGDIAVRNRRMLTLSRRLRRLVGEQAALGAIVPDPVTQRYWPSFPYRSVRALYDVFLPMAYWTPHVRGAARVYRYTSRAVGLIRLSTGDAAVPVHVVGGIANRAYATDVAAFTRAALQSRAAGASLYDAAITSAAQWAPLERFGAAQRRAVREVEHEDLEDE